MTTPEAETTAPDAETSTVQKYLKAMRAYQKEHHPEQYAESRREK